MTVEEFDELTEQLLEEFASCFDGQPPQLSDYAVSREGIYSNCCADDQEEVS